MFDFLKKFTLQIFAEGGDGGDGGTASEGETAGVDVSSIPARAQERYRKAFEATKGKTDHPAEEAQKPSTETEHIAYKDLIRSDEYKDEHEAYMKEAIGDRLKKYKGMEEETNRQRELLNLVGRKYGIDPNAEGFLDNIAKSIEADDSYYEKYAMEHDMSPQEARKVVSLENRLAEQERQKRISEQQAFVDQQNRMILAGAQKCKEVYPNFDLDTEWKNPRFVQLAKATNWDLTSAYQVVHMNDIMAQQVRYAANAATNKAANAVRSGMARPVENGLNAVAPSQLTTPDFRKMNKDELHAYAEEQRRLKGRR